MRDAVVRWHDAVNGRDLAAARAAVTDPVLVSGPRGIGPIDPEGFADWIIRSGVELRPTAWHPFGDSLFVVEQDARWPGDPDWTRVATVFRTSGDRVGAVLRFPDLAAALAYTAEGPGETLFRFVRHWSRRAAGSERGRDVLVTEAVHALRGRPEVTVTDVAAELGLDQSGASRMVTQAVGRGYLAVQKSDFDARRRTVRITAEGESLLAAAHRWQEETFAALTDGWTEAERSEFHRAMRRLTAD